MSLDPALVQRVRSYVAVLEPRFDDLGRAFTNRFATQFPGAAQVLSVKSRQDRFDLAAAAANLCKNLGRLDDAGPSLAVLHARLRRANFGPSEAAAAKSCVFEAVKKLSPTWSPQIENDWRAAVDEVFTRFAFSSAARAVRRAA